MRHSKEEIDELKSTLKELGLTFEEDKLDDILDDMSRIEVVDDPNDFIRDVEEQIFKRRESGEEITISLLD